MFFQKVRNLVQQQALHVHLPGSLLQGASAVGDGVHNLRYESLVRGDPAVPALHKLAEDDGQEGVQLQVDIVAARQGWQQILEGRLHIARLVT